MDFETRLQKALKEAGSLETSACPDDTTIGHYAERGLSEAERARVEAHMGSCLHCLGRLVEMRELLYLQKKESSVSPVLLKQIEAFGLPGKKETEKSSFDIDRILSGVSRFLLLPLRQWRYAAVGLVSACIAFVLALSMIGSGRNIQGGPSLDPDAFARVRALNAKGDSLRESQGLIISRDGLVAADLSGMAGASSIQLTLRNGKSFNIKSLWKDESRNLALLKIEGEALTHFKIAAGQEIGVGQRAFVVGDSSESSFLPRGREAVQGEAVISDFKPYGQRRGAGLTRYIQLASLTARFTKGAIIDSEGRLLGIIVTGERNISFAAPLEAVTEIVARQNPVPVADLKDTTYSADAFNSYFKGILARDAGAQDAAIEFFRKAVQLNPNLEAAYLELGFLYYKKRIFDLERKAYEEALKINPENADTLFYLATNMETTGQHDDAIRVFEKVVSLDPDDADAWYELGLSYIALGEKEKAMKAYSALKGIDPGLAEKLRRITDNGKR